MFMLCMCVYLYDFEGGLRTDGKMTFCACFLRVNASVSLRYEYECVVENVKCVVGKIIALLYANNRACMCK